jgi:hypothetical protein
LNGQDAVDRAVTRLFEADQGEILSVDFSQFDATVPFDILTRVFSIIGSWFGPEDQDLIRFLGEAFMRTGFYLPVTQRCPEGYRHGDERTGGVPSGSGLTSWVDGLANMLAFHYAVRRYNKASSLGTIHVCGDDGLVTFRGPCSVPALSEIMFAELGMTVKMEPGSNLVSSEQVRFLQMDHHKTVRDEKTGLNRGMRPVYRAFIGMTGHERRPASRSLRRTEEPPVKWKGSFNTYRWLQQMEPCRFHPKFDNLLLQFFEWDRYLQEALDAIERGDPEVDFALAMLQSGEDETFPVRSLRKSVVVLRLREMFGL